jgi:cytochrome c oxidase cbb3-type subunit II
MSELSAAAAAALGLPEAIVQRSAAARAAETGMSVDDVLAAWAGGGDIPAPVSSPEGGGGAEGDGGGVTEETSAEGAQDAPAAEPPPAAADPEPVPAPAPAATAPPSTATGKPPVLVGEKDNPLAVLVGAVGLFIAVFLVGVVGPALPADNPGARTSDLPYSQTALVGQDIYQSVGCGSCHSQMVRPVVADVGLGAVSLNDTNQILGSRRFGPDLSNVGARVTASQLEAVITGLGGHPSLSLSSDDLDALVSYLVESATLEETPAEENGGEEAPAEDAPEEEPAPETTTAS